MNSRCPASVAWEHAVNTVQPTTTAAAAIFQKGFLIPSTPLNKRGHCNLRPFSLPPAIEPNQAGNFGKDGFTLWNRHGVW
jgi:hypothetical protein